MDNSYTFHPQALLEYREAARHYLSAASPLVAERFVAAMDLAVETLVAAPTRFRIAERFEMRRSVVKRFPYVVFYRWEQNRKHVTIYAVSHTKRAPGYWLNRYDEEA